MANRRPQREDHGKCQQLNQEWYAEQINKLRKYIVLVSDEEPVEEEEAEQQNFQPTAKIGAKKQKKLEEKQQKKAQREVRAAAHQLSTEDAWFFTDF